MARHIKGSTPKLTKQLITNLSEIIKSGAYIETAAAMCSISKDTLYRWLRESQKESATPLQQDLFIKLRKAMAEAELRDISTIDKAAQEGAWKAAAWRLERKYPSRWGRTSNAGVAIKPQSTAQVIITESATTTKEAPRIIITLPDNGRSAKKS